MNSENSKTSDPPRLLLNLRDKINLKQIVQWPSQNFKDDLDINYIWVFISFYVNRGIRGPKKPNLLFPTVGQIFYKVLKSHRQKTFN